MSLRPYLDKHYQFLNDISRTGKYSKLYQLDEKWTKKLYERLKQKLDDKSEEEYCMKYLKTLEQRLHHYDYAIYSNLPLYVQRKLEKENISYLEFGTKDERFWPNIHKLFQAICNYKPISRSMFDLPPLRSSSEDLLGRASDNNLIPRNFSSYGVDNSNAQSFIDRCADRKHPNSRLDDW